MTDHPSPPSDEDLSAAIDGEAEAEALARIAADPDSATRTEALQGVADLLGASSVPALDDETVDTLVATALAAPVAPEQPAIVHRSTRWLVAAVIALLVGVGLTLVWTGRDAGEDQALQSTETSAEAEGPSTQGDADTSADASLFDHSADAPAEAGSESTERLGPLLDLGSFDSGEDLRQALATTTLAEQARELTTRADSTDDLAVERCADQLEVALDLPAPPQAQAVALVDDTAVLVYEFTIDSFEDGQPTTLVAAVDTEACAQVIVFER